MSKLERHIRVNRDRFDSFEPPADHMARFRTRLKPQRVSLYARIPNGLKIAALLAVVAFTSVFVYEQGQRYYANRQQPIEEILPGEYVEAKIYYTSQIKQKYTEIDRLSGLDPERREILFKELDEMDRLFQSVMRDLQTAPTDERILSTMINHYQLKLDVMGQIIQQLEEANEINSTYRSHEKTEV